MTPYRVLDRLILNVEQVIPLPEAEEITVKLRRREVASRAANRSGVDRTKYVVSTPDGDTEPLPKRRSVLAMVHAVHKAGATAEMIQGALGRRFRCVDGTLEDEDLVAAFLAAYPKADRRRSFFSEPVYEDGRTWVCSNQWGGRTEKALTSFIALVPDAGISFSPAP